jgi:hypothetical protein
VRLADMAGEVQLDRVTELLAREARFGAPSPNGVLHGILDGYSTGFRQLRHCMRHDITISSLLSAGNRGREKVSVWNLKLVSNP